MDSKKQTETMNMDSKHSTEDATEEICAKALQAIHAVGYPEATQQMQADKEEIYARTVRKIHADTALKRKSRVHAKRLYTAAVALSVILSTTCAAYLLGIRSGKRLSEQSPVEVTVPYGVTAGITLPDGSRATLNGGSRLTYPALFDGNRQVRLSGEGYFDIVNDKTSFTVNAAHISVKVLGTRFGFKAYDDDAHTVLTLEEGRIKAFPAGEKTDEGFTLEADQQLILNNETGEIRRQVVNAREYTSWKDGILTFRNQTLGEIAVILRRRFNIDIRISGNIKNESYGAQFKHDENIEQILDKLSYKRTWKYAKHNNVIEITEY
jgi:ferric-dicitrate binding protein FerR (iron transport regulator)